MVCVLIILIAVQKELFLLSTQTTNVSVHKDIEERTVKVGIKSKIKLDRISEQRCYELQIIKAVLDFD